MRRSSTVGLCAAFLLAAQQLRAEEPAARVRYPLAPSGRQYCGVDGLYVGLRASGQAPDVSLAQIEADTPLGPSGVSLDSLVETARKHRVSATVIRTDLARVAKWGNPALLHVRGQHYVTLLGMDGDRLLVFDNAIGLFDCTPEWFDERYKWEGIALVLGDPPPELFIRTHGAELIYGAIGAGIVIFAVRRVVGRRKTTPLNAKS